jgi:hypothetical protein
MSQFIIENWIGITIFAVVYVGVRGWEWLTRKGDEAIEEIRADEWHMHM